MIETYGLTISDSVLKRFWAKVRIDSCDNCWEWIASKGKGGYGQFWIPSKKKLYYVHRLAWVFANGPIPDGFCCCHRCDNPVCVNVNHMFLGTVADNNLDCVRKKRHAYGERNAGAKLTQDDVLHIRNLYNKEKISFRKIANIFSISGMQVSFIIHRKRWKHIPKGAVTA